MPGISLYRRTFLGGRIDQARGWQKKWLSLDERDITEHQLFYLRQRWQEATANIPYYRQLVESGEAPKDFSSLAEFRESVPVLTRDALIQRADQFRREAPSHHTLMTAGSTGAPLQFGNWRNESAAHTAINQWVGRFHNGMGLGDRVFLLWGHSHLLETGVKGKLKGVVRTWKDRSLGYRRVDAYHVGPEAALTYFDIVRRFRPQIVVGYACALDMWIRHNVQKGHTARDLDIKLCVACSEMFPHDDSRELLQEFLGCPVIMEYGGVDFGVCAYELQDAGHYRTFWWSHLLEVEEGRSEGPLLLTNLTDRYLPLFRYRNGDECEGAQCTSDGYVVAFDRIRGRIHDVLDMPDGRTIHSMGLFHCIHQEPVWSIQLVVHNGQMRIRLAARELTEAMESRIRGRLRDLHPDLAACPLEVVDDVATNRAGKRRWIVYE